jgi:hypothetical protein
MAARKRRAKIPLGDWRYVVGEGQHELTAYEREDRAGAIYWRAPGIDGGPYRGRKFLHATIRDAKGDIVPELEIAAQRAAVAQQSAIQSDTDYEPAGGPLTLRAGFRRLLDLKRGKYPARTKFRGDVERASKVIRRILGDGLLWSQLKHAHYRQLWRAMAAEHRDSLSPERAARNVRAVMGEGMVWSPIPDGERAKHGLRAAELTVGILLTAARWLQQEGAIEPGSALPAPNWKELLRAEWEQITEAPLPEVAAPAYTWPEMEKLWAALDHDPRLGLALEIGAELRLGQVPRSRRTDVLHARGFRIGAVRIHGKRKKKAPPPVILTMAQRHALTRAMTSGYLADLEAAYQRGEITDYYLIPGGRLLTVKDRHGRPVRRAQVKHADEQLELNAKRWKALEKAAGVEHKKGRGWYGLRRLQADRAEDVEPDARALNAMGGWTHTQTRERYQQKRRTIIAEKAAVARSKIRPRAQARRSGSVVSENELQQKPKGVR